MAASPAKCRFRIGKQVIHWREGEHFVFDNTYEHEAWNDTGASRVVLFLDFDRPLPEPLATVNRWIVDQIAKTRFMAKSRKNLDAFHARVDGRRAG